MRMINDNDSGYTIRGYQHILNPSGIFRLGGINTFQHILAQKSDKKNC